MRAVGCVSDQDLKAFALGELPPRLADMVAGHLDQCPECAQRASTWDNMTDTVIRALRQPGVDSTDADNGGPTVGITANSPQTIPSPEGYTLLQELGRGATGVVFKARQHHPERIVALKCLVGGSEAATEHRARFLAEADAIARLDHPHIVRVHAVGEHQGALFLCLEYLDGGTLRAKIAGQPQPPREAAQLVESLARAVQHAHEQGVIHRDLKPANVLLTADGTAKVADFGLARFGRPELTATGVVLGTPSYMAPEQAEGQPGAVGPPADIYALGAILYELLTGRPPFKGATVLETLEQVRSQEPVGVSRLQPSVPLDLETVCLKALAKEPARRYRDAAELADDLGRFRAGRPVTARPASAIERAWRWCRRNPAVAGTATVAAVALVAGAIVSLVFAFQAMDAADNELRAADKLRLALLDVEAQRDKAREKTRIATLRLAESYRATALVAAEMQRNPVEGILWLAKALETVPDTEANLQWSLRFSIAAWSRELRPLSAILVHPVAVRAAVVSPDGKTVVTAAADKIARLWDAATGDAAGQLVHASEVRSVAFSPDGKTILTGSLDGDVQRWDAATRQMIGPPWKHPRGVTILSFSPDGKTVLTGCNDRNVRLWDVETGLPTGKLFMDPAGLLAAAFSSDGLTVITAGLDKRVRRWEAATGKLLAPARQDLQSVLMAAFSPDAKSVLTVDNQAGVRVEVGTGKLLGPRLQHQAPVHAAAFSQDGQLIVTGCEDHKAWLWDAATGQHLGGPLVHQDRVNAVAFSASGGSVLTVSGNLVRVWVTPRPFHRILAPKSLVHAAAFSPDGKTVLVGCANRTAQLWDAAASQPIAEPLKHPNVILAVAYSPDSKTLLTGGRGFVRLWDAAGKPIGQSLKHGEEVQGVAFSPDGRTALSSGGQILLRSWEVATGKPLGEPLGQGFDVRVVAFSPDRKLILTNRGERAAQLWEVATGRPVGPLLPHPDFVRAAAFSPHGEIVLTVSANRTVRQWEVATGKPLGAPLAHQSPVDAACFSPDGRVIVTGTQDRARLWEAATGKLLGPPLRHAGLVLAVAVSPDGRSILTAGTDDTARLWETPVPADGSADQVFLWVQALTGAELDDQGAVRVLDGATWQERRRRCGTRPRDTP